MKQSHRCPKCQSTSIIANVTPLDASDSGYREAELAVYARPTALVFTGKQSTTMSAWVCDDCGFVEFYAANPKVLVVQTEKPI
jgi:predicted nucleic-acid-binding Zn-ribbon protein